MSAENENPTATAGEDRHAKETVSDKPSGALADAPPKKSNSQRPGGPASLLGVVLSDRYKIERLIGEGGMGAVYQAEHTLMRKRLAVKVLHPEMSRMSEVVARFEREAMAAAHIDHPNVAAATDFGKLEDGSFFLVLEFIEGISLRSLVAQGRLPLGRALNIARQMIGALVRAHAIGIVHRDLKPENVMLVDRDGDSDFVKVLDFGIAKVPIGGIVDPTRAPEEKKGPAAPVLTQAGMVYGTPEYMAPEQAMGNSVDARADLYAVGVMMYEMLTGNRPFEAESKVKLLGMQVTAPVPPMAEKDPDANVPPEVEALVKKLLEKEASDRPQDAKEVLDALLALIPVLVTQGKLDASIVSASGPASTLTPQSLQAAAVAANAGALGVAPTAAVLVPSSRSDEGSSKNALAEKAGALLTKAIERVKAEPKIAALAGGGALVFLVTLVVVVSALKAHASPTDLADAGPATSTTLSQITSGTATTSAATPLDDRIHEGVALVDKADFASGITTLTQLPDDAQKRPDVRRALATAYAATEKNAECMRIIAAWLEDDPPASSDQKVRIMVRDASISADVVAADLAFSLQEKHMGTVGLDDLYDTAYGLSGQYNAKARDRARAILKKSEVRNRMTGALKVTLDIVALGQSCKVKDHLERAATDGDARTVAVLKPLTKPVPTGWFGKKDALYCLHDGALQKTIAQIEARMK